MSSSTDLQINSYIGQKGYTIYKNSIRVDVLNKIMNELTIEPKVSGAPKGTQLPQFSAYRETLNKIYIPYYYGIENFGIPKSSKLTSGIDINIQFNGSLRPNQIPVVEKFMSIINETSENKNKTHFCRGGLLELPCAFGKTCLALNIISQIKKKTIIIVHKEFLMNQWIERINEFLPNTRIGKIQGKIIDIENKDIVIGMLQSLSMKQYDDNIFKDFGLVVIDEVHHISSMTFSNALFKIVTKHTLGLSATMNRKDGTTNVFKMFLGNVIYKGSRDADNSVTVRAIEYIVNDEEFNETIVDYRGNTAYSKMLSKLCTYNRRTEFILKILTDMFAENNKQQIMILAHNKNILTYLFDAITHRKIASVGYYIGGMKEQSLKESEKKQVVIATYAMAAEALDIKTLTTLIMATPKTDIEQSVGRILREKHSNPVVVDIIDSQSIFQNQWKKRKTFYKKENYKIINTKSNLYNCDISTWKTLYYPKQLINNIIINNTNNINNDDDDDDDIKQDLKNCGKCLLKLPKK